MAHTRTPLQQPTSAAKLEEIITAADAAFDLWSRTDRATRAVALSAVADALDAHGDELVELAGNETHLPEGRLRGELKRTTFQLRLFSEVIVEGDYLDVRIDHADAEWPMGAPRPDLRRTQVPLGPTVVFAASNFPFAFSVAGGDTASALAAGCTVVLKVHSGHPKLSQRTAEIVVPALRESGAPEGTFAVIFGTEAGREALLDPRVKAGAFTGSIPGGRALFDLANGRPEPIPFYGELGSVNPVFVTRAADASRGAEIAEGFLGSMTMGAGQFCTKPGLLFVPEGSVIAERIAELPVPAAAPLLNDRIQRGYVERLRELRGHNAVHVLLDGEGPEVSPPTPTVLQVSIADVFAAPEILGAECFGPTGVVVSYEREEQLLEFARSCEGQLTASLFGEEDEVFGGFVAELTSQLARRAGRVIWNQWPTGVSVTYAQQHGGPYPATTAPGTTSVGTAAISRFVRPVAYQGFPQGLLPVELRDADAGVATRRVNGRIV